MSNPVRIYESLYLVHSLPQTFPFFIDMEPGRFRRTEVQDCSRF